MTITSILRESFYSTGRGPELKDVHYSGRNRILKAVDYSDPNDDSLKHLLFSKVQIFMFTPEEVYNYASGVKWSEYKDAAILCLGKSEWLESFSPRHLENCLHYQVMFYDEFLDVICEGIEVKSNGFLR